MAVPRRIDFTTESVDSPSLAKALRYRERVSLSESSDETYAADDGNESDDSELGFDNDSPMRFDAPNAAAVRAALDAAGADKASSELVIDRGPTFGSLLVDWLLFAFVCVVAVGALGKAFNVALGPLPAVS